MKVSVANKLYSKVLENKSNVTELEKIREEAIKEGLLVEQEYEGQLRIVGMWNYENGAFIRLVERQNGAVFSLETGKDNCWKQLSLLKIKGGGEIRLGASLIDIDIAEPHVVYRISQWDSSLHIYKDERIMRYSAIIPLFDKNINSISVEELTQGYYSESNYE